MNPFHKKRGTNQHRTVTVFCLKCNSFDQLEENSISYYLSLSPQQRLDTLQYLREQYYKIKGIKPQRINKKICKFGKI